MHQNSDLSFQIFLEAWFASMRSGLVTRASSQAPEQAAPHLQDGETRVGRPMAMCPSSLTSDLATWAALGSTGHSLLFHAHLSSHWALMPGPQGTS